MSTTINNHVFHGFYSNFGYAPFLSPERKLANVPIHFYRATYGVRKSENDIKVLEFDSEEDVLKWYKKDKYESGFDQLKFPDDFCKNYFIIPESQFYKYTNLFHRMVKGIKIKSEIELETEGTFLSPECPQCKKQSKIGGADPGDSVGPIVFTSPDGKPAYFIADGVADDIGYLNGIKITDGNAASSFNQDLIPKTKETTLSFTAVDTLGANVGIEAVVRWYKEINFKQKIKYITNFDSSKIFEFSELEKRIGSHGLIYSTSSNIKEDKHKEELRTKNLFSRKKFYKDNWVFDQNEFNKIFIRSSNEFNKKFNFNATDINDPVLILIDGFQQFITSAILSNEITESNSPSFIVTEDSVNKQKKFEKTFDKLGENKCEIENENSVYQKIEQSINFEISDLFYIKSKKIYLCFVELDYNILFDGVGIDKDKNCGTLECEDSSPTGSVNIFTLSDFTEMSQDLLSIINIEGMSQMNSDYSAVIESNPYAINYKLTTNDSVRINSQSYFSSQCSTEQKKIEYDKFKCKIKLNNEIFEIELNKFKDNSIIYDNKDCNNLTPFFNKEIKHKTSLNIREVPTIEINFWEKKDFNKNNTFPPKKS